MGSSHYASLPSGWVTLCTKGHAEDHNRKCLNWISPQGRKYREWSEVQAYFQLQNFEEDLPGLECRAENVRKYLQEQENVTLEEATRTKGTEDNIVTGKNKPGLGKRKKKNDKTEEYEATEKKTEKLEEIDQKEEDTPKPKKRGRKKKEAVDEDYVPEVESKKTNQKNKKTPTKKKAMQVQEKKSPTLDETSDLNGTKENCNLTDLAKSNIPENLKSVNLDQDLLNVSAELEPPVPIQLSNEVTMSQVSSPSRGTEQKIKQNSPQIKGSTQLAAVMATSLTPNQNTSQIRQKPPQIRQQTPASSQIRQQTPASSQIRQQTPTSSQIRQQTPTSSQIRQQTPASSQIRKQTPASSQIKHQTPKNTSQIRQQTPNSTQIRQQTPNSTQIRQQTPTSSQTKQQTPKNTSQIRQVPPRLAKTLLRPETALLARSAVGQSTPGRQAEVRPLSTPGRTPVTRTGVSTPPSRLPGPRQQSPAVRPQSKSQTPSRELRFTEVPVFLKSHMKFPSRVQTNSGGGSSLYKVAVQHCELSPEKWRELRRYCHDKMSQWWEWYQPYYTFPLQVKIKPDAGQVTQKTISSSPEFLKFLTTEESLHSFYLSECELYCLANILGITINVLTYSGPGKKANWNNFDPHQGLLHANDFVVKNAPPLYCLHEEKNRFNRLVKLK